MFICFSIDVKVQLYKFSLLSLFKHTYQIQLTFQSAASAAVLFDERCQAPVRVRDLHPDRMQVRSQGSCALEIPVIAGSGDPRDRWLEEIPVIE